MDYLKSFDGPVFEVLNDVVFAKAQPQYNPLRCHVRNGEVTSRWTLTPEQRKAIAEGADIYLTLLTFNQPLQPIRIGVE